MPQLGNCISSSHLEFCSKNIFFSKVSTSFAWLILASLSVFLISISDAFASKDRKSARNSQALINQSVKAYGGHAKILSLKSFMFEYQVKSISQKNATPLFIRTYFNDTDFFRSEIIGGNPRVITVLNKNRGWVEVDGTRFSRSAKSLSPLRNETLSLLRPDLLLLIFSKHRYSGHINEEGRSLEQVLISGFIDSDYIRGRLSINSKTFLVEKYEFEIERETKDGTGIFQGQNHYLKYNQINGFKLPQEILSRQSGKTSHILITSTTLNKKTDKKLPQNTTELAPNKDKSTD